jgi:hypothetical protein
MSGTNKYISTPAILPAIAIPKTIAGSVAGVILSQTLMYLTANQTNITKV